MPSLTSKQISDINNSMVAMQSASVGTLLGAVATGVVTTGSVLPVSASLCLVATGLSTIYGYNVTFTASPTLGHTMVSACVVGTNLNIRSWCPTSSGDATPKAATSLSTLQWTAVGTL